MNKFNLKPGQTVYFLGKPQIVDSVGNKYFTLKNSWRKRFFLDNLRHDGRSYSSDGKVYLSLQEINDEKEHFELSNKLERLFKYGNKFTLNTLREIVKIIERKYA